MSKPTGSLRQIPGIGASMEKRLNKIGIEKVEDLVGRNAEDLYTRDCVAGNEHVDRCVLYVYRLAVYYAENETHEADKMLWWNWKE